MDDLPGALADLHARGLRIVGADGDAALTARESDLRGPVAIVVGSEGKGLGPAVRRRCDLLVRIPMHGRIDSLNAAVAGSILLYEAAAQRGAGAAPDRGARRGARRRARRTRPTTRRPRRPTRRRAGGDADAQAVVPDEAPEPPDEATEPTAEVPEPVAEAPADASPEAPGEEPSEDAPSAPDEAAHEGADEAGGEPPEV